jgi:prefoldin subunit 5
MNIDERLEKLAQRHEALSQNVELLTRDVQSLQDSMKSMQGFIKDVADGTARLLHVAEIHERRISRLEGESAD